MDLFQSCGHCRVFQMCCHFECNTLTAASFRIWNSSTGIPSPPLTLFVVMFPKAHLILLLFFCFNLEMVVVKISKDIWFNEKVKVAQLCLTPWNSPGQNIGVGSLSLLQGIFPTLGSNPGFPHCRRFNERCSISMSRPSGCQIKREIQVVPGVGWEICGLVSILYLFYFLLLQDKIKSPGGRKGN